MAGPGASWTIFAGWPIASTGMLPQVLSDIANLVGSFVPPGTSSRSKLEHKLSRVDLIGVIYRRLNHDSRPLKVEQIHRIRCALYVNDTSIYPKDLLDRPRGCSVVRAWSDHMELHHFAQPVVLVKHLLDEVTAPQ